MLRCVNQERYCDESGMPTPFTIMSTADQVLRRALVTAMSHCRHSCGTVPLPAIGFLLKLLSYHDSGSAFDDSAFLSDLMEAVQSAAMHATPSSGNYECNLTFLEEERRSFVGGLLFASLLANGGGIAFTSCVCVVRIVSLR